MNNNTTTLCPTISHHSDIFEGGEFDGTEFTIYGSRNGQIYRTDGRYSLGKKDFQGRVTWQWTPKRSTKQN